MASTNKTFLNSFVAQAELQGISIAEAGSDIVQLVNMFPQDVSDEVFAQELKKKYQCKKLRAVCTQLGLHPQADPSMNHKAGYIKLLSQYRRSRQREEVFPRYPKSKTKPTKRLFCIEEDGRTKHCGLKLINVLFSRAFIARMVESGALPSTGIEVDATDGRAKYWKDVATAYDSDDPEFHRIVGTSGRYEGIDLRLAPRHSPAKLYSIWKDITTRYEKSIARWNQLGMEDTDFAHFCNDMDVLYLYDKLQIQPIRVDLAQLKAQKRGRTGRDVLQESENTLSGADSDEEEHLAKRRSFLIPSEVEAPTQRHTLSAGDFQGPTYRKILPTPSPEPGPIQRQNILTPSEGQTSTTRQNSRGLEESVQQSFSAKTERRSRLDTYDGVIYSSQAVRDMMSAIEALERGNYDRAVIAQAKESMDAIVQVWLRELNEAKQPRSPK